VIFNASLNIIEPVLVMEYPQQQTEYLVAAGRLVLKNSQYASEDSKDKRHTWSIQQSLILLGSGSLNWLLEQVNSWEG
jgi:hypothetical protein